MNQKAVEQASAVPDAFDFDFSKFKASQQALNPPHGINVPQAFLTGVAGAGAGATIGAAPVLKEAALSGIRQAGQAFRGGAPTTGVQNWTREMGYGQRGGTTYSQAHQFEQGTRPGSVIRNPSTGQVFKPEFRFQKPPIIEPTPLQQVGNVAKTITGNPIVQKGLGGFGVGAGAAETMSRIGQGDIPGAAVSGLSALGSAASMFPPTAIPGALVSGGAGGALMLMDKIRNKMAEEAQNPPIPEPTYQQEKDAYSPYLKYRPPVRTPQQSKGESISGALLESLDEQLKEFSSASG
jgi:hypothetical protein